MDLLNMLKPSQPKAGKVYNNCSRSVAKISTVRYGPRGYQLDCGSGFIWDRDLRLLVTCYHVIRDASEISVTLDDGVPYGAEVFAHDEDWDIAVLIANAPQEKLWPITAGDSDEVRVGDEVAAIGSPFGYRNSLSTGVISGVNRECHRPGNCRPTRGLLQTDASLNPGNSGGPLFDIHGKVIGINTCIIPSSLGTSTGVITSTGVGFAVPVNKISEIIDKAMKSANNIEHSLGIESLPSPSGECHIDLSNCMNGGCVEVKQEHPGHFHHNHKDVIGYISREVSSLFEVCDIIWKLENRGKYKMRNGDVLVCRGYCEECDKMDVDILSRDYVDKIGLDHIHGTPTAYHERWSGLRDKIARERICWITDKFYNDCNDRREAYDEVQLYQFGPILGNKSAPDCSLDIVNDIIDQLERDGKARRPILRNKLSPNRSLKRLDARPLPGLNGPSLISGPAKKEVNNIIDQLERDGKARRPILRNKLSPHGSLKRLDARPLPGLNGPSLISGPAKKESLQRSQLEELLKSFICCCSPTSSRKTVSCTKAAANKSSNTGRKALSCTEAATNKSSNSSSSSIKCFENE